MSAIGQDTAKCTSITSSVSRRMLASTVAPPAVLRTFAGRMRVEAQPLDPGSLQGFTCLLQRTPQEGLTGKVRWQNLPSFLWTRNPGASHHMHEIWAGKA